MLRTTFEPSDKKAIPAGVEFFSLLLLLYGTLELVGCFFLPRNALLLGYIAVPILLIVTAMLVLFNHKWALHFVLAVTIAATLGIVRDFWSQTFGFSSRTIWVAFRMIFLGGLYWCA
jgi:hypothetical protein